MGVVKCTPLYVTSTCWSIKRVCYVSNFQKSYERMIQNSWQIGTARFGVKIASSTVAFKLARRRIQTVNYLILVIAT